MWTFKPKLIFYYYLKKQMTCYLLLFYFEKKKVNYTSLSMARDLSHVNLDFTHYYGSWKIMTIIVTYFLIHVLINIFLKRKKKRERERTCNNNIEHQS